MLRMRHGQTDRAELGGGDGASVAWQAHIGGFLAGLMLFSLFDPVPRAMPHAADASWPDGQGRARRRRWRQRRLAGAYRRISRRPDVVLAVRSGATGDAACCGCVMARRTGPSSAAAMAPASPGRRISADFSPA